MPHDIVVSNKNGDYIITCSSEEQARLAESALAATAQEKIAEGKRAGMAWKPPQERNGQWELRASPVGDGWNGVSAEAFEKAVEANMDKIEKSAKLFEQQKSVPTEQGATLLSRPSPQRGGGYER